MRAIQKDTGYAYMILISTFSIWSIFSGILESPGLFHVMFLDAFDGDNGDTAVITAVNYGLFHLAGPVSYQLVEKFGYKTAGLVGGVIGTLGIALSSLARNLQQMIITYGVIAGFGMGILFLPNTSILGSYFEKNLPIAIGIAQSGGGLGRIAFPPLLHYLNSNYGWRGAMLLTAGLFFQVCLFSSLFRNPPDVTSVSSLEMIDLQESPTELNSNTNITKEFLSEDGESQTKSPSENKIHRLIKSISRSFSLDLLKNSGYTILCLSVCICYAGLGLTSVHLLAYVQHIGLTRTQGSLLYSVMGFMNILGKLTFGFLCKLLCPTLVYAAAYSLAGLCTLFVPLMQSTVHFMIYAVLFGFLTGASSAFVSSLVKLNGVGELARSMPMVMIFTALGLLVGPPLAGWLYDTTRHYDVSFYFGGATILISGLIMFYPVITLKQQKHRNQHSS